MSTAKERYRCHCEDEADLPIFVRDWWLDATCGPDGWDASLCEDGGRIVGAMPYALKRRAIFTIISQPMLTPALGPWIRAREAKYATLIGYQKDTMEALIDGLPRFDYFVQNWTPEVINWQPFYWRGFKQTMYFTYILDDLSDLDTVWAGMQSNRKSDFRKATARYGLRLRRSPDLGDFLALNRMVFHRKNITVPYSEALVEHIDSACASRHCRRILIAEDSEGRAVGGLYLVWDRRKAYYLMGGSDPNTLRTGVMSFLVWEAIKLASEVTKAFDFEGSMLENVERFFRGFGARQIPYNNVTKVNSTALMVRDFVSQWRTRRGDQ